MSDNEPGHLITMIKTAANDVPVIDQLSEYLKKQVSIVRDLNEGKILETATDEFKKIQQKIVMEMNSLL
jgi:hypothetical protein